jgi:hypothetical protein
MARPIPWEHPVTIAAGIVMYVGVERWVWVREGDCVMGVDEGSFGGDSLDI